METKTIRNALTALLLHFLLPQIPVQRLFKVTVYLMTKEALLSLECAIFRRLLTLNGPPSSNPPILSLLTVLTVS